MSNQIYEYSIVLDSMYQSITIIIPTLNEERHIERCIDSLMCQSFPFNKMEILIVDGGSVDNTINIVKEIAHKYDNIKTLFNEKKIQSCAFNIGVENSTCPIIIRLDAHSTYHPEYIRLIVSHLSDKKYGNVGGRWIIKSQRKGLIPEANAIANQMRFAIGGADFRVGSELKEVETVPFGGFRREVIEEIGEMNPNLPRGEDNEYNARIIKAGYKILFNPNIIATYYARPDLTSFLHQMYANGFSIGVLLRCYRQSVGLRHIVPLIFFLSIIILLVLGVFLRVAWWILICELALYFLCSLVASIIEANKYGWRFLMILPWEIFLVHISYGWGTLVGLFKGRY